MEADNQFIRIDKTNLVSIEIVTEPLH